MGVWNTILAYYDLSCNNLTHKREKNEHWQLFIIILICVGIK